MADLKISQLTGATTPLAGTEVLPIVQSGTTKQVSVANLTAGRDIAAANLSANGKGLFGTLSFVNPSQYAIFDKLTKASIAASGTAVIDIVVNDASGNGFSAGVAEVDLIVAWDGSPQTLQGHYKYQYITVNNSTGGGTATIAEIFNGSAGNFSVATGNFVVSRPAARTIRITYTNASINAVRISALVKGFSLASASIT